MAAIGRGVPAPPQAGDRPGDPADPPRPRPGRTSPLDETESLARLGEHERELDRKLEEARQEAKEILARARQEADRLRERAEAELADGVERLRQERSRELERALAVIRQETGQRSEAVRGQAESNRERVLTWLLARVAGRDAP
jgi:V/A-type H+-transporting ATPase subunit G/H